jgi:hypothetical protein
MIRMGGETRTLARLLGIAWPWLGSTADLRLLMADGDR